MKPSCPRLFEVEAARDGRLTGLELARFKAHVSHCAPCAHEAEALDAFGQALRSLPAVANDDLRVRRGRTRLLAAFNTALLPAPSNVKRWLVPLLAAASITALTLTLWHSGSAPTRSTAVKVSAAAAPAREAIAVLASPASQWSRQVESHRETITLTAGTLTVSIDHTLSPRRLRVLLPDGELEDLGTTFSVTATPTATTHVAVQDGTVILRLRERAPIILGANQTYSPSRSEPPAKTASPLHPPLPAPARAGSAAPVPSSAAVDAASEFRAALSALNAGENARAASLFSSFLASHPTAPNAEDAAYLRVLALQRAGNAQAMRSAARDYLARYPAAFRRAEVEPLAR